MLPLLRVMAHVDTQHPIEMPTSVNEDVIQASGVDDPHDVLLIGHGS